MRQFPPAVRKTVLTAHVTASLGWLGAVAAFLALAVAGLAGDGEQTVRGAYVAMDVVGWAVIVPLSVATLVTGVAQSLGTVWGLVRHYWVIAKLLITVLATLLLLVHMQPVGHLADAASRAALAGGELQRMRVQLVADAGAAIVVLLTAAGLSVFKPRGMTRYGIRRRRREQCPSVPRTAVHLGADLATSGPYKPAAPSAPARTATTDAYTVTLDGDLQPGAPGELKLNVSKDGRPVTDLQPYLGAYGHLVALRTGDLAYLHVHPNGEPEDGTTKPGPGISFTATAPSNGTYRLFLDFQHDNTVRTAAFTLQTGTATTAPGQTQPPATRHEASSHQH